MARPLEEAHITTRNSRKNLCEGLHWRSIDVNVHLGYRRRRRETRGGTWVARWYKGKQKYQQEALGTADDEMLADGTDVLTFHQASSLAKQVVAARRSEAKAAADGPPVTVATAVEEYIKHKEDENRASGGPGERRDIRQRLQKHVLSRRKFAAIPLFQLTEEDLADWKRQVAAAVGERSTVTRIAGLLKAALNRMARAKRSTLPDSLPTIIKFGLAAEDAAPPQARHHLALPDDLVRRLVSSAAEIDRQEDWAGDLHRMITVLAATGARFDQVARMKVGDVQFDRGRLMVPPSRKGRGTKATSHIPVAVDQAVLDALLPVTKGRALSEPLLERWFKKKVGNKDGVPVWIRDRRGRWTTASGLTAPWALVKERAGIEGYCIPYSLRHSSIVRQLSQGIPTRLVAIVHDTSIKEIEKHYSAAIVDIMGDVSAAAALSFDDVPDKVVRLKLTPEKKRK